MTQWAEGKAEESTRRRDWIILPLLAILTVVSLSLTSEKISELIYGEPKSAVDVCLNVSHPDKGVSGIPNCKTSEMDFGVPLVEYKFDTCGYRSGIGCVSNSPGAYRIAMIGTSIAFGQWVKQQDALAAKLPIDISERDGRKIYLYNEGMLEQYPQFVSTHVQTALSRKPNIILWLVTPYDISVPPLDSKSILFLLGGGGKNLGVVERWKTYLKIKVFSGSFSSLEQAVSEHFIRKFSHTGTGFMLQDLLNKNADRYVKSYLKLPDTESGYLRVSPSSKWKQDMKSFEDMATVMIAQSRAAGVPLVVTLIPSRAQAAMLSSGTWPEGYDPYRLDNDVRSIITRHGGIYADIFPDLKKIPNMENNYYFSNGHPDANGDAILAQAISKEITNGQIPDLEAFDQAPRIQHVGK